MAKDSGKESQLTPKQQRFVDEYLLDLNATQAAIRAGYSEENARQIGSENLSKLDIQNAIQSAMDARSQRTAITADRVLNELAKLAFSNIQDFVDDAGNLKSPGELSRDDAAAIQELTQDSIGSGEEVVLRRKYKLSDKKGSLELLGKHLKLFTDKVELAGKVAIGPEEWANQLK